MKTTCIHYMGRCDHLVCPRAEARDQYETEIADKRISLQAARAARASQVPQAINIAKCTGMSWAYDELRALRKQIADIESELDSLPVEG
jgi:hypothetical protein